MGRARTNFVHLSVCHGMILWIALSHWSAGSALADAFDTYRLMEAFDLPTGVDAFDALSDGRIIILVGDDVYIETGPRSRVFSSHGTLPSADISSYGAAFVRVSPDGSRVAIGNNGGNGSPPEYEVGVFEITSLMGDWFAADHFDAEWIDDRRLAVTAGDFVNPGIVTALDTESADPANPVNPIIIQNIGGASGGIAFDQVDNLYTGNGYSLDGPSGTGATMAFGAAVWIAALGGGPVPDFELDGTLVVDILSASPLLFDSQGHLFVGGGDLYGSGEGDFAAVVRSTAVAEALAGMGPADPNDPAKVRRLDPDTADDSNVYSVNYNAANIELYIRAFGSTKVYVYADVANNPFASTVIDYQPAPGQFVNNANFNNPTRALGSPNGGGTAVANNTSVVTLGGFGGSITLGFDHTVTDDPLNPFGMDAIVFGNAFWVGRNPNAHWAECGTIQVCSDLNGNGRPDDDEPWYLIPGSHIPDPVGQLSEQVWDDDVHDEMYPPPCSSWIPPGCAGVWTTWGYELPYDIFGLSAVVWNPNGNSTVEGIFGYADYSPTLVLGDLNGDNIIDDPTVTPEGFYTTPDDPLTVGVTAGSGGGDAFDIAWAVDPVTNEPALLTGFDFIRLTTGVNAVDEAFETNEKSVEIDAVADVAPDPFGDHDNDGDIDLDDIAGLQTCFGEQAVAGTACERMDRQGDALVDDSDVSAFVERITGPR